MTTRHGRRTKHRSSVAVHLLQWKNACLRTRYLSTAVALLLISCSLPSNWSSFHDRVCDYYGNKNAHYALDSATNVCIILVVARELFIDSHSDGFHFTLSLRVYGTSENVVLVTK
jgi:hypothetical protein